MKLDIKKAIIIAPHPDDETLGVGGTIKRMINESVKVSVLIVSGHMPPLYKIADYKKTLEESKKVFKYFGVKDYEFLNIPATKVNEISVAELNDKIKKFISKRNPDTIFVPFPDRHIDHRIIFDSSIVASRPVKTNSPKNVLLYETLSETHWNVPTAEPSFVPDFFINIDKELKNKLLALKLYKSQINNKNPSRSIEAAKALAKFRGSQNGCNYAEAFKVARIVI
jgi:N-acetylglucosamine malate deacetylase 1